MHAQYDLLKTVRFWPLFVTQFLGAFNDNVFKNALVMLITFYAADQTGIDPTVLVTAAAGIFILPFFLFSATAGQLADKHEKSAMIRKIKIAEIILMCAAGICFAISTVWGLMVLLFLMGTQSTFFGPLKYGILPTHLDEDELIGGNAIVEAGTFLAILLGTILGGVLGGTQFVAIIVILTAIIGYIASRKIPEAPAVVPDLKINYNIFTETGRIVMQTRSHMDVFLSIIGISWFWLVGFVFLAEFPAYGKEVIGGDQNIVTLFLTFFSIGIAVGSLLCNRLLKGEVSGTYVPYAAAGLSLFTLVFCAVSPSGIAEEGSITMMQFLADPMSWAILGALFMVAVCGGIYIVPLYAIMQSRCDADHRARTIAANNVMNAAFMVVASLITMGLLSIGMSIVQIFIAMAVANLGACVLAQKLVKKQQAAKKGSKA